MNDESWEPPTGQRKSGKAPIPPRELDRMPGVPDASKEPPNPGGIGRARPGVMDLITDGGIPAATTTLGIVALTFGTLGVAAWAIGIPAGLTVGFLFAYWMAQP